MMNILGVVFMAAGLSFFGIGIEDSINWQVYVGIGLLIGGVNASIQAAVENVKEEILKNIED